eukprot:449963-Pyramimonas_sp.AAC.2
MATDEADETKQSPFRTRPLAKKGAESTYALPITAYYRVDKSCFVLIQQVLLKLYPSSPRQSNAGRPPRSNLSIV